jgi:transposase
VETADQLKLFETPPKSKLQSLSQEDLIAYIEGQADIIQQMQKINQKLKRKIAQEELERLSLQEKYLNIQDLIFGKSSEKVASPSTTVGDDIDTDHPKNNPEKKKKRVLLPSERYPDAELIERRVELKEVPECKCCGKKLQDSGLTEDSEYIEKIPAQYKVIRERKVIYSCKSCYGDMQTTESIKRIKPGSAYGDGTIIDIAVSKYCDLIPITRQVKMAERLGFPGLPHQSLIETTHYLADFLRSVYIGIKNEVLRANVLYADETPHRMLEGHDKSGWYFWGFSSEIAAYFESHDTRSGDVSIEFIKNSKCEYLMSDVYSGYGRTETEVNQYRLSQNIPKLRKIYCNAHARRKFIEADAFKSESDFFIKKYQKIYLLYDQCKDQPPDEVLRIRAQMIPIFREMKAEANRNLLGFSSKSSIVKAYQYFLKNYNELTEFTKSSMAPIDNNHQERLLRNPVIGRKTWYGTHSVRGAETAAILFSIVESCKMNQVNPRTYLTEITSQIHAGHPALTPAQFKTLKSV